MTSSIRIFQVILCIVSFAVKVFLARTEAIPFQCKFHEHSFYACVVIGLENHNENVAINGIIGNHATNGSEESIVELVIKGQNISFVPKNVGKFLPKLKNYEVQNSSLVEIKRQNFENIHQLESLILSFNLIESLNQDVFQDLTKLKRLRLSGNRLTQIHHSTLANNVNVEVITLDNNRLLVIHEQQFMSLCKLKEIHLHNNMIEDLRERTFVNNERLETITLYNNKLKTVGSQLLVGLKFLKFFDFSSNECIRKLYKTLDELTDIFHDSCFPPYLEDYKNKVEELEETLATVNETLSNCNNDLEGKTSLADELQTQVDILTDEKSSAESDIETCNNLKETAESSLESCQSEKNATEKASIQFSNNLTQCRNQSENFIENWKFINKTVSETTKNIDDCHLQLDTLRSTIQLSERASQSKVNSFENDKQKMRLQIEENTKQLEKRDNEIKSLKGEIEQLRKEIVVTEEFEQSSPVHKSTDCVEKQQSLQAQLSTCMTTLPMCNSFFIQCSFQYVSKINDYVCSARYVSACQPGMKLTVGGIHLASKSISDVNTIEIQDSIFHFTEDLIVQLPNLRKIVVKNSGLSTLEPKLKSLYLKTIQVSDNKFVEVPSQIFSQVQELESLQLENNGIETLYRDSFFGLANLSHLSLKTNKISVLPEGVFSDLLNLEQLSMKQNRLTTLNGDLLKYNTKLQILKFDENKNLKIIGSSLLDFSRKLTMVQFSGTCTKTNNDDDVENVRRGIELYCRK